MLFFLSLLKRKGYLSIFTRNVIILNAVAGVSSFGDKIRIKAQSQQVTTLLSFKQKKLLFSIV